MTTYIFELFQKNGNKTHYVSSDIENNTMETGTPRCDLFSYVLLLHIGIVLFPLPAYGKLCREHEGRDLTDPSNIRIEPLGMNFTEGL